MDISKIKAGKRVAFTSRSTKGRGVVESIEAKGTGTWVTIKSKDHPKGVVTVRPSQIASA